MDFLESKTVPCRLTSPWLVLKPLVVLASEPPVVGALRDAQPSEDFTFGERGRATLTRTAAFSAALKRWYRWRRRASGWPFF